MRAIFGPHDDAGTPHGRRTVVRHIFELATTDPAAALVAAEQLFTTRPSDQTWLITLVMRLKIPTSEVTEEDEQRITKMSEAVVPASSVPIVRNTLNNVAYLRLLAGNVLEPRTVAALRVISAAHADDAAVSDTLAWALIQIGDANAGLELSERSLQRELSAPLRAAQLAVRGIGFAATGRMDEAKRIHAEVIAIDPSCPVLVRLDDALATRGPAPSASKS